MNVPYVLLAPLLLTATTVTYVFAGPSHGDRRSVEAEETVAASGTPATADTPTPVVTEASTETATPDDALPDGLAGQLTYRTGSGKQLVRVGFPGPMELSRETDPGVTAGDVSADGLWRVTTTDCSPDESCEIVLQPANGGAQTTVAIRGGSLDWQTGLLWSREGHTLVYGFTPSGGPFPRDLVVIDDPAAPQPRVILNADGDGIFAYTWLGDGRVLVSLGGGLSGHAHLDAVSLDGSVERLVDTPQTASYLYPSPDGAAVAFTQQSDDGWRLYAYDSRSGVLRDLGNMGSDPAGTKPPEPVAPEGKGPMYIGWSPDGTRVAFGGGFDPPYIMTTVDLRSGKVLRTEFPDGYPGEIKWSPDGARIAVSAYNVPRTHHESYIVDPETGIATDVLSGCVIVWSPDSRFLAIHGEKIPGVAIADVVTLEHAQLTHGVGDTPLRWTP
jgi:Tol biopolymer transport system component